MRVCLSSLLFLRRPAPERGFRWLPESLWLVVCVFIDSLTHSLNPPQSPSVEITTIGSEKPDSGSIPICKWTRPYFHGADSQTDIAVPSRSHRPPDCGSILMLPLLIFAGVAVVLSVVCVVAILGGPTKENETVSEVKELLCREAELEEQERLNEEHARELKEQRERIEKMEREMKEEARIRAKRAKERVEQQLRDDEKRKKEEEDERERVRIKQKDEEEKRKLAKEVEQLKMNEKRLQAEVERAKQMAEQQRLAREESEKRHGSLRGPTRKEFEHALRVTQYDESNFHFAVVGRAGCGKSSLINAFRNLTNKQQGAAPTGTKETTLEIGRYPDPGDQPPRQWMIWFDVPGAGTHRISLHDYFIKQGLYMFDLIILAIGDRFEEIDARILENCARFSIPTFIVRSKADMHILNSMKEYDDEYERISDDPACYKLCRDAFIKDTRQTVDEEMTRQGLPTQPVYIVSRDVLRRTYNNSLETSKMPATSRKPEKNLIHESHLVNDLLTTAAQRRCDPIEEQVI